MDRLDIKSRALTPRNQERDISLSDKEGVFIEKINQSDASRLLKHCLAELMFEMPPSIKLIVDKNDQQYQVVRDWDMSSIPRSSGTRVNQLGSKHYGNYHVVSPTGTLMFHCGPRKCLWYLSRNLADIVNIEPPTIQLKFKPKGFGHAGDDYYLASKRNECVVCRSASGLSRHHVVPSLYRKFFAQEVKDHSYHDVLLLCCECHEKYEREADRLKVSLAKQYDCPVHGMGGRMDRALNQAVNAVNALKRYGDKIPEVRKKELRAIINRQFGDADFDEIADLNPYNRDNWVSHGQYVVEQLDSLQYFVQMWREHFINSMHPINMPEHWDLQRSICKSA